ncbi:hypothetical protein AAF712_004444 [Marasmius tenuissimus]|uniref:Uncharacterized protein n=1 Tax=Marasmius tenuissimus TaxID=585030 RepID=A0ABR3A3A9_9AGAR
MYLFRSVPSSLRPFLSVLKLIHPLSSEENITTLTKRADDPNSKNQLPLILGVVLGALFFAVIIIWAVWYHLRWRRRQRLTTRRPNKPPSRFTIDPFIPDPPKSTLPRYGDYTVTAGSNVARYGPGSSEASSSGGGSRHGGGGGGVAHSQAGSSSAASAPLFSPLGSEPSQAHTAITTPPTSVASPTSPETPSSRSNRHHHHRSSPSRRRRRRERREQIAEMRREVETLRTQQREMMARLQHSQELPEYSR